MTPSPCIRICEMDEKSGLCRGCYRTMAEIMAWRESKEKSRRAVLREIEKRRRENPIPEQ